MPPRLGPAWAVAAAGATCLFLLLLLFSTPNPRALSPLADSSAATAAPRIRSPTTSLATPRAIDPAGRSSSFLAGLAESFDATIAHVVERLRRALSGGDSADRAAPSPLLTLEAILPLVPGAERPVPDGTALAAAKKKAPVALRVGFRAIGSHGLPGVSADLVAAPATWPPHLPLSVLDKWLLLSPCSLVEPACAGLARYLRQRRQLQDLLPATRWSTPAAPVTLQSPPTLAAWFKKGSPSYAGYADPTLESGAAFQRLLLPTPSETDTEAGFAEEPSFGVARNSGTDVFGRLWWSGGRYVPLGCSMSDGLRSNIASATAPLHDTLVVMAQFFGDGPAHLLMECVPRLLLVRSLVLAHPGARVQVTATNSLTTRFLEAFGVPADRLVAGAARARTLVVPEPTGCGNPSMGTLTLMRRLVLGGLGACPHLPTPWANQVHAWPDATREAAHGHDEPADVSPHFAGWMGVGPARGYPCSTPSMLFATAVAEVGLRAAAQLFRLSLEDLPAGASASSMSTSTTTSATATRRSNDPVATLPANYVVPANSSLLNTSSTTVPLRFWSLGDPAQALEHLLPPRRVLDAGLVVLLIERKTTRRITNQDALERALRALPGIDKVVRFNAKDPWADFRLFADADIVVAPHGAGESNLVACPPWTHVIELLVQPVNIMYAAVSLRLGLRYHGLTPKQASQEGVIVAEIPAILAATQRAVEHIQGLLRDEGGQR